MKSKPIILLISLIIGSCNHEKKDNKKTTTFTNKSNVTSSILIGPTNLLDPWDISILDTTLIIGNEKGEPLLEVESPVQD